MNVLMVWYLERKVQIRLRGRAELTEGATQPITC
jgi:hypothetical protein